MRRKVAVYLAVAVCAVCAAAVHLVRVGGAPELGRILGVVHSGHSSGDTNASPLVTSRVSGSDLAAASFALGAAADLTLDALVSKAALMHERGLDAAKKKYEDIMLHPGSEFYFKSWYVHNNVPRRAVPKKYRAYVHRELGLVFQTIPKNGCSVWRSFNIAITGRNPREHDVHSLSKSGILLTSQMSANSLSAVDNNASILKVITVRNPIVRTLSAYLSKRGWDWAPFWQRNFPDFVQELRRVGIQSNEHYRPQLDFAAWGHFDVVAKFEEQSEWAPPLLEYLHNNIKNITDPSLLGSISRGIVSRTEVSGRYRADILRVLQHYDMRAFAEIENMYAEDIVAFGYTEEVQTMKLLLTMATSYGLGR